ncbi:MAG: hypothetical protein A2542_03245, partial [Parcubacteria group bacterium RIFOXYD2_FULL_52_8]
MTTLQKSVWGVLIVLALGAIFIMTAPKQGDEIQLGFIGPLSGDAATYGETEKNATELALKEINTARKQKIIIVYEDGRCTAKDGLTAAQKLLGTVRPQVILGGTCSAETLAIAPVTERAKVILFSDFSSNPQITNAGDYVFRNAPSDSEIARTDAEKMLTDGRTRIALLSEETDYSIGVRDVMRTIFAKRGVSPMFDETYASTLATNDFRTILLKIKAAEPDAVYINTGTSAKTAGLLAKQAKEVGITAQLYSNFQVGTSDGLAAGGKALEGIIYSDAAPLTGKGKEVLEKYKAAYGKEPGFEYAMTAAYDRMYIIAQAIDAVGYDAGKIKAYLYRMPDFAGATGTYHFDGNGDV